MPACPQCGHAPPNSGRHLLQESRPEIRPFWQEVLHAFIYPLTPLGIVVICGSAGLMALLAHPVRTPEEYLRDYRSFILGLMLGLFLTYYFFEVIQTSAGGTRWFPKFLKSDFDWYETLFYGIEGVVVSYLPDLVYLAVSFATGSGLSLVMFEMLRALGCLYAPMALLTLAVWRDTAAVLPQYVLPLMRKIPRAALLSAFVLWTANTLHLFALRAALDGARWDVVAYTLLAAAYLYFVAARVIGIAHWVYRHEIGWFRYD